MNHTIVADLHNHTTASDGDFSPDDLVSQAKRLGLKAIAITDHDTLGGLKAGVAAGDKHGIQVIPGVEISIRFKRSYFTGTLHLLCYFSADRLSDESFEKEFSGLLARGRGETLVRARIDEINRYFGPETLHHLLTRALEFDDIARLSANATRRHFALALKESLGIMDDDVINSIIGNNSPAYLPSGIELKEVMDFIRDQRLVSVLAHPAAGSFPGPGHYKEVLPPLEIVEKILPEFIGAGIKGLEVFYPGHVKAHQELMKSWAKKHDLLMTGGSDCHDGKERPLGVEGINESDYQLFKAKLR
jgi:predicted metal-dependent phosphoesterase TrpH